MSGLPAGPPERCPTPPAKQVDAVGRDIGHELR